jgi:hypothetical protein
MEGNLELAIKLSSPFAWEIPFPFQAFLCCEQLQQWVCYSSNVKYWVVLLEL